MTSSNTTARASRRTALRLLAALGLAGAAEPAFAGGPVVGKLAPSFQVTTLDGATFDLADFAGRVVLLNFWATWCAPCRAELPLLDGYFRRKRDAGLVILGVATQDSASMSELKRAAGAISFPLVARLTGPYYALAVPTNYVIDRAGVLRYARAGAFDQETLEAVVEPLLNTRTPRASVLAA